MNVFVAQYVVTGLVFVGGFSCVATSASSIDSLRKGIERGTPEQTVSPGRASASSGRGAEFVEDELDISQGFSLYFEEVRGGEAALALAEGRYQEARDLFHEIAMDTSDIEITPRARLMSGLLSEKIGDDLRALEELPPLAGQLSLLADRIHFLAARAAFRLGRYEAASDLAVEVADGSLVKADATILRGDALAAQKKYADAIVSYGVYEKKWPGGSRRSEAEARIVACLAEQIHGEETHDIREAVAKQALDRLARLRVQSPASRWTSMAASYEKTLFRILGRKLTTTNREKKGALLAYGRGSSLMKKMRNSQAEQFLSRAVRLSRAGGSLACLARYDRARAVSRQRRHEEAAALFEEASGVCKNEITRIKSLYRGAKSFQSAGLCSEAVRLFSEIESSFSYHSYADDARLKSAKCYRTMGQRRQFVELLETLPESYPAGDMRAEALWLLAHDALRRNDLVEARDHLQNYYRLFPNETGWNASGRSGYWLGRVEEMLGSTEVAVSHYEQVMASSPLTYYMILSFNRIRQIDPDRAKDLRAKLRGAADGGSLQFSRKILDQYVNLARGVEFHRLGLFDLADREFEYLRSLPDVPADVHWLAAVLVRRTDRFHELHKIARTTDHSWLKRYPTERDEAPWYLAFPTAYEEGVLAAAKESAVPKHMIWGVMREESGFDHKIESTANALGLMQLILPTARSMGRQLGIRVNRRTLARPKVNIRLGAAYLGYLSQKFKKNAALVIAAYNAGEGAIARWHRARPRDHVDLFVEDIPYSQTRGYTKRVLATWARYLFLYGENHPILSIDLVLP